MVFKKIPRTISGFTIIEVMVTVAIIAILSAILMYQFRNFDSKLLLRNLTYEIAIALREAQVYGVGVQGTETSGFQHAYGLHFEIGNPTQYLLFRDTNDNGIYNPAVGVTPDERISTYTIGRGNRISGLCDATVCGKNSLDITFKRPESNAIFAIDGSPFVGTSTTIYVASATGNHRIVVFDTGQISLP